MQASWIDRNGVYTCSNCGGEAGVMTRYCSECGCKMSDEPELFAAAPTSEGNRIASVMIRGKLPSLNEYVKACRTNRYAGARMKDNMEQLIMWQLAILPYIKKPVFLRFTWYEKNKKRDKDNVAFGKKFVLDAFQKSGKLPNDNNQFIAGFTDRFVYEKDYGVLVEVLEVNGDENCA